MSNFSITNYFNILITNLFLNYAVEYHFKIKVIVFYIIIFSYKIKRGLGKFSNLRLLFLDNF